MLMIWLFLKSLLLIFDICKLNTCVPQVKKIREELSSLKWPSADKGGNGEWKSIP